MEAVEKTFCEVLSDILYDIIRHKTCTIIFTLIVTFIFSIIPLMILCENRGGCPESILSLMHYLSDANKSILGFDIASLSILMALFRDVRVKGTSKEAFTEQFISFIGNAFLQFGALIIFMLFTIICYSWIFCYIVLFIQIWALILVFDLIVEIYTLKTKITN